MIINKDYLISVFQETESIISIGGYKDTSGDWHEISGEFKEHTFYKTLKPTTKGLTFNDPPKIYVEEIDTLQKAREMGPDCAILNMASYFKPGGGVLNGAKAQEEDICRRSNLYWSLLHFKDRYPIPKFGGIYTRGITVFKSVGQYNLLHDPFTCSCISFPGIKLEDPGNIGNEEKYKVTLRGKIRGILRIAVLKRHGKLVLGALGCGAYKNPPVLVAEAFKEVLEEKEFEGRFEEICFAILPDKRGGDKNKKEFQKIFPAKTL